MKKFWLILGLGFYLHVGQGQTGMVDPEVGIVEHLNDTIPLHLKFVNENSDTVTLGEIVDKPTIFSFVYFDCPGLCSPLLEGVGEVIKRTDLILGKDYQVVTISFNFRDTPEKAKEKKQIFTERYAKDHKEGWHFLTSDSMTLFKVTNAFGYKVKAVGFDFVHPSAIIAVSPHGKITRYLYGLSYLPLDFKMALIEAQKEEARPAGQKILLYCFAYDPAGKRYVLDVLKVSGTLMVFVLILFGIWLWRHSRRKKTINS
ncbi:MAG: SCO family protein [Bacteroidales bacterium]